MFKKKYPVLLTLVLHVRDGVVVRHLDLEKKLLLYIKFKNFMNFLPLKKCVTTLNFF